MKKSELMHLDIHNIAHNYMGWNKHFVLLVDEATEYNYSLLVIKLITMYLLRIKVNKKSKKNIRLGTKIKQEYIRIGLGI